MGSLEENQIDSHFHIWDLEKFKYPWPRSQEGPLLYRQVPIEEYEENTAQTPVKHGVFIQVLNNCPEEARWLLSLAKQHKVIKGVVAGLDVTDPKFSSSLDEFIDDPVFVGLRHILDFENPDWLIRDDVIEGLKILAAKEKTFDLLLRPHLTKHIPTLSRRLPNLKMVVDHIAKPHIKDKVIDEWKDDMEKIAKNPNIYCKLSGMVTEADLENWKKEDLVPYIKHALSCFGAERCMFGSDWPVCTTANASFARVRETLIDCLDILGISDNDKKLIFRDTAIKFYNLQGIS